PHGDPCWDAEGPGEGRVGAGELLAVALTDLEEPLDAVDVLAQVDVEVVGELAAEPVLEEPGLLVVGGPGGGDLAGDLGEGGAEVVGQAEEALGDLPGHVAGLVEQLGVE